MISRPLASTNSAARRKCTSFTSGSCKLSTGPAVRSSFSARPFFHFPTAVRCRCHSQGARMAPRVSMEDCASGCRSTCNQQHRTRHIYKWQLWGQGLKSLLQAVSILPNPNKPKCPLSLQPKAQPSLRPPDPHVCPRRSRRHRSPSGRPLNSETTREK